MIAALGGRHLHWGRHLNAAVRTQAAKERRSGKRQREAAAAAPPGEQSHWLHRTDRSGGHGRPKGRRSG